MSSVLRPNCFAPVVAGRKKPSDAEAMEGKLLRIKVECAPWVNEARERTMKQRPEDLKMVVALVLGYTGQSSTPAGKWK